MERDLVQYWLVHISTLVCLLFCLGADDRLESTRINECDRLFPIF
jgi:hypothetical protein